MKSLQRLAIDPLAVYGTLFVKCPVLDTVARRPRLPRARREEIAIVSPKIVVMMGEDALDALDDLMLPLAHPLSAADRRDPAADTPDRRPARPEHRPGARRGARQARLLGGVPRARRLVRRAAAVLEVGSTLRVRGWGADFQVARRLTPAAPSRPSAARSCRACRPLRTARRRRPPAPAGRSARPARSTAPDASSGSTLALHRAAPSAPSPRAGGRSVEPGCVARLHISARRSSSARRAGADPDHGDPAAVCPAPRGWRPGWARRPARGSRQTGRAQRSPRAR